MYTKSEIRVAALTCQGEDFKNAVSGICRILGSRDGAVDIHVGLRGGSCLLGPNVFAGMGIAYGTSRRQVTQVSPRSLIFRGKGGCIMTMSNSNDLRIGRIRVCGQSSGRYCLHSNIAKNSGVLGGGILLICGTLGSSSG